MWLPIGYIPKDFLAYVAFIRQVAEDGSALLVNPFTTEPQDGRFILLLHQALGIVTGCTGLDPFLVLELSRFPLTVAFFLVLWWFLGPVMAGRRERGWACVLVAFSGGLGFVVRAVAGLLPADTAEVATQDLWQLYGWSTFDAMFNPLWIAGLTLALLALRPLIHPGESATVKDRVLAGSILVLMWFIHSYSTLVVLSITAALVLTEWWSTGRFPYGRARSIAGPIGAAIVVVAAITCWQMQDEVFSSSTRGVFGSQTAPVFWYPLTLAVPGLLALRGWRSWRISCHPWRLPMAAWLLAVALLHSSPVLNGYHFVYALHLPVCILAASAVPAALDWSRTVIGRRMGPAVLVVLAFSSSLASTIEAVAGVEQESAVPTYAKEIMLGLEGLPVGNVLAPAQIGNLIPAFTPHRTFVGHWFLTPDFRSKEDEYWRLVRDPRGHLGRFRELVENQNIRHLVVPEFAAGAVSSAFPGRLHEVTRADGLVLLTQAGRDGGTGN